MIEKLLRLLIYIFPNNVKAHYRLAVYLSSKSGNNGEAEEEFRKTIAIDPKFRDAYYALFTLLWEKEDWETEVEQLCHDASMHFPNDPMTFLVLGYLHEKKNQTGEAEEAYRRAISFGPRFTDAYEYLIGLLMRQKRYLEARKVYHQSKDLIPQTEKVRMLTAYALHTEGHFTKAAAAYRKVIQRNPQNGNAYLNLGILLHEELNKPDEAEQAYKQAIQANPNNSIGYFQLGWLLHEHYQRYEEAEKMFLKALEYDSKDETALYNLACIKAIQKDYGKAFQYLEEAIQHGFDQSWAWNDPDLEELRNDPRFIEIVAMKSEKKEVL